VRAPTPSCKSRTPLVPVVNHIRTYWWCRPPRTGRQRMVPASLTARETGASFSKDIRSFLSDAATGKLANLPLQIPVSSGCSWKLVFSGRTKTNDAGLKTFSSRCDGIADAWELFPDDKTKSVQLYFDPEHSGKSTVVIVANAKTGKWETSLWDFFHDQTFAVVGHHDDGSIKPTRFEFLRS
jgi:hypothetical protein